MFDPTATGVTITVRDDGSLRVAGPVTILDGGGAPIDTEPGRPVSLCRCGGSAGKPFCDGTHRTSGFRSTVRTAAGTSGS